MNQKIKIISFQRIKQNKEEVQNLIFSNFEKAINIIIFSIKKRSWSSQLQTYCKKQLVNDVKLLKCTQLDGFKHILTKIVNTKHQKTICVMDFSQNQKIDQFQTKVSENKDLIDSLKLLDFILVLQQIQGIDKKLFVNPNIKLITTEIQEAKQYILKQVQVYRQLKPQSSVSTINENDEAQFQQNFNKVFNQVKVTKQEKQTLNTGQQVYSSTPGVGTYWVQTNNKKTGTKFGKQGKNISPSEWSPSKTKNQQKQWWGSPKQQKSPSKKEKQ